MSLPDEYRFTEEDAVAGPVIFGACDFVYIAL